MNKNKSYKINYLSEQFYIDYDKTNYPEIESKSERPYMVMLIQIENNKFAVPFRTNVPHNNCYKFNDKEYIELNDNYRFIVNQFQKFISDYIKYANSEKRYYASKKFKYSTLKYFHKELGIEQ